MPEPHELAKTARATLSQALQSLQTSDDVPEELFEIAEPVARAMGLLHKIERAGGSRVDGAEEALILVRNALDKLQSVTASHPAVDQAMEAIAGSLGKLFSLSRAKPSKPGAAAPPAEAKPPAAAAAVPAAAAANAHVTGEPAAKVAAQPAAAAPASVPAAAPAAAPSPPKAAAPVATAVIATAAGAPAAAKPGAFKTEVIPVGATSSAAPPASDARTSVPVPLTTPSAAKPAASAVPASGPAAAVAGMHGTLHAATPAGLAHDPRVPAPPSAPLYAGAAAASAAPLGATTPLAPAAPGSSTVPIMQASERDAVVTHAEGSGRDIAAAARAAVASLHADAAKLAPSSTAPAPTAPSPAAMQPLAGAFPGAASLPYQPIPSAPAPAPFAPASAPAPAPFPLPPAPAASRPPAAAQSAPGKSRVDVELGAHSPSNFYKGLSGNDVIEHGGIFVATYRMPRVGTQVSLRLHLPGDLEFDAEATVQFTREVSSGEADPGFGAKFTQISAEGRQLVYRYTRNREPMFYDDL